MTENERLVHRVSAVGIGVNILLTAFKLLAGILAHSGAMLSDAVHSASDVLSTVIVLIGVKLSGKAADETHPYGHDRFECVASIILAGILLATGIGIGASGIRSIFHIGSATPEAPGVLALTAAAVSIVVKEWMYWYTRAAAKRLDSVALMASAWDHRSDAFSSVGAFAGILGARLGLPILDPIASVIICLFILKVSVDIFCQAIDRVVDRACPKETEDAICRLVLEQEGVCSLDVLRTRQFGAGVYVDIEIAADGSLSLREGHEIAERVHHAVEQGFPNIRHCMVHVNPAEEASPAPDPAPQSDTAETATVQPPDGPPAPDA